MTVIDESELADLFESRQWDILRERLRRLHPSDVADIIVERRPEEEGILFRLLPKEKAAQVFSYLPPGQQQALIRSLSNEQMHALLDDMTPDDRTRLLEEMPGEVTRKLLATLDAEEVRSARALLGYPEHTAGRYMTSEYAWIYPEMTAQKALERVRKHGRGKETLNWVYVIDDKGKLIEDVRLSSLVLANPEENVLAIDDPELVSIRASQTREEVLQAFAKYDRVALPVTDDEGHMLGIITVDDALDIANAEATNDIQKMGGSEALGAPYLDVGFWQLVRKRGGWLSALFLGEMLTASAMGHFEGEIARAVVLALFVPLIISSGGNSGSQAASIIIRSLALNEIGLGHWLRVFRRELMSSVTLGTFLGFIGFVRIIAWQHLHFTDYGPHYMLIALTVWVSLVGVVMFGSLTGSMLPFIMHRLGFDPATSSAPFVATLVDVTGLVIYFTIALVILRGTLL